MRISEATKLINVATDRPQDLYKTIIAMVDELDVVRTISKETKKKNK